jgi:transposase
LIVSKGRLAELYRRESDAKVKERLLLVIRIVGDGELPAHVVKEIHRSKPWGSYWPERYREECLKGLRNKPKSGRIPQIPLEISTFVRVV